MDSDEDTDFLLTTPPHTRNPNTTTNDAPRFIPRHLSLLPPLRIFAPRLTHRQWHTLHVVGVLTLFSTFASVVAPINLRTDPMVTATNSTANHILPENTQDGNLLALVPLGSATAVVLAIVADVVGRKIAMIVSVAGFAIAAVAAVAVSTVNRMAAAMCVGRMFSASVVVVGQVIVVEEFDATNRGWGVGALAAFGAAGYVLALLVFGLLDKHTDRWKAMTSISSLPLIFLPCLRSSLQETSRFSNQNLTDISPQRPIARLLEQTPGTLFAAMVIATTLAFTTAPASNLQFQFLQTVHHLTPSQIAFQGAAVSFFCAFGYTTAGHVSDLFGRKKVMVFAVFLSTASNCAFFLLPPVREASWVLPLVWIVKSMDSLALTIFLGAITCEIFPNSHRATARGVVMACSVLGELAGMAVENWTVKSFFGFSVWTVVACQAIFQVVVIPAITEFFPETSGIELESVTAFEMEWQPTVPIVVD